MRLTFCGVRGSTPAPGAEFTRYGGQTSCVALAHDGQPPTLLLDAGTGMNAVSTLLDDRPFDGSVLLTHLHWDHTHGMPFFAAGGAPGARVQVRLPEQGADAETVLAKCFSPPHFPIFPSQLGPGWTFDGLEEGEHEIEGFTVLALEIPHKGGRTFGYRVSCDSGSLAYLPDHSPTSVGPGPDGLGERHPAALALADGVDVLVADAQHLACQFPALEFLGHATVEYDVALALEAGARSLALFHHAPSRTDDQVDAIAELAADLAGPALMVVAAREGLTLDLPSSTAPRTGGRHGAAVHQL